MRVLLDTQVLVQAYLGSDLPRTVHDLLSNPDTDRVISAVSLMEIALKNGIGKLDMSEPHTKEAVRDLRLSILPFSARHAYQLFSLPAHHSDPFDRMIIATALVEKIPVIGGDRQFSAYKGLRQIW